MRLHRYPSYFDVRCSVFMLLVLFFIPLQLHAADKPNVLIILADDLGYSDLGCYGGEIATPNLDGLAKNGLRFTQFYNTARCWPTRAALLTGYYAQQVRRDTLPGIPSGGRSKRQAWAKLLPARLKAAGYRSYHSGKWHLDGMPLETGFDRSYYLRDQGRFFNPKIHYLDDKKLPEVKPGTGYYGTTAIADHAVECLRDHAENHGDKPFFHYLAFTAPHFPLHALPEDIARYRDRYTEGWDKVRGERWQRIQEMQLVTSQLSEVEREVGPPYHFPQALKILGAGEINRPLPWSELSDQQRKFQADKMAVHAAMIDRMDREIGRVLAQIKKMNALDDTLIMFLSDNGASAEIMVRADGHDPQAAPGSAASYLCLGPGWSTSSNTPFRRHKTWVHEGGIATPLIVHWPDKIKEGGQLRRQAGHAIDVVPTILEAAGVKAEAKPDYVRPPFPGKSLLPTLAKDNPEDPRELWWLHEGNRAFRSGQWKIVAARGEPWELYDLKTDRSETDNLAAKQPERVKQMATAWEKRLQEFRKLAVADLTKKTSNAPPVKKLLLPGESFHVQGRPAFILLPPLAKRKNPQPWIFYAPTLPGLPDRHETWMHRQFLDAGVAVAGIDIGEAYGSPQGRKLFDAMYREMTQRRGYARRLCLLGRSRGGLWMSSWASRNPEKVAGIAGIYPVFDLTTYPGLKRAATAYRLTEQQLRQQLTQHNPIEGVGRLAKAGVPAVLIHGDQDKVVPLKENSAEFVARYRAAGAEQAVKLIVAPGQGHNYWPGFFRCQELVDFAIARAKAGAE